MIVRLGNGRWAHSGAGADLRTGNTRWRRRERYCKVWPGPPAGLTFLAPEFRCCSDVRWQDAILGLDRSCVIEYRRTSVDPRRGDSPG